MVNFAPHLILLTSALNLPPQFEIAFHLSATTALDNRVTVGIMDCYKSEIYC